MENAMSVSSRQSLYSAESATSEEEEEEHELEVFLLDSGSDVEKETGPVQHQRDAYSDRQALLFSPGSGRTSPGLVCRDHKCRTRKPLGLLASARLRPTGPRHRPPTALEGAYCMHLMDTGGSLPRQPVIQTRTKGGGRKRPSGGAVAGGQGHTTRVPQPSLRGGKKPRNEEPAAQEDPHTLCWPEGDLLFARKCQELQGFVQPLIELLSRLKMGRFAQGLSSFQQSVAMDRIQRIIGVLQKPEMGGRYLGTLLQVERMLKLWFPRVTLKNSCADCGAAAETAEERDKPSMEENVASKWAASTPSSVRSPPGGKPLVSPASPDSTPGTPWAEPAPFLADWPAMNLTWIHTAPISTPPLGQVDFSQMGSTIKQALLGPSMSAYGVVVFFQNNLATLGPYDHTSPASCHSNTPLPGSAEHPRCRSLPGPTVAGSQLPRGTLDRFSRSLPRLPTSSEERQKMGSGTSPYSSSS
uniref:Circadian associated repressor of transcription n=2 Tax=Varanus komodoensis TaxID=61221 RepID=A0A8D2IRE3_VARKO